MTVPNSFDPTDDVVKKLTQGVIVLMVIVFVLLALLVYNYVELQKYSRISSGDYFTEEQCVERFCPLFDLVVPVNGSAVSIGNQGVSVGD